VQVEPQKPMLKAPGTKPLKLDYDEPPSVYAFQFNLRSYIKVCANCGVSSTPFWRKAGLQLRVCVFLSTYVP